MKKPNEYQEALDYIFSYVDYSLSRNLNINSKTFDLNRMRTFMNLLGSPQEKFRSIHVAGTKGKGSTAAFIAGALQASGFKVGLYISPHLSDFCERIQINRRPISHSNLIKLINFLKPMIEQISEITTFEITTALAFYYFAWKHVDFAVVEVGLGGRLDATNVIIPEVSVITSLSMDHMAILGDTLEKIAAEKAGIIKPGIPVVTAPQKNEALRILEMRSKELKCELIQSGKNNVLLPLKHNLKNQSFKLIRKDHQEITFTLPLLGYHQIINAVTAYESLAIIQRTNKRLSLNAIKKGFQRTKWPARFEIIQRRPAIILDSAHNKESAQRLKQTIIDYFPEKHVILIFGASEDKDINGMLETLSSISRMIILSRSIHPRAMDIEKLFTYSKIYFSNCIKSNNVGDAIKIAMNKWQKNDIILITGSIFIAAAARENLRGS